MHNWSLQQSRSDSKYWSLDIKELLENSQHKECSRHTNPNNVYWCAHQKSLRLFQPIPYTKRAFKQLHICYKRTWHQHIACDTTPHSFHTGINHSPMAGSRGTGLTFVTLQVLRTWHILGSQSGPFYILQMGIMWSCLFHTVVCKSHRYPER